MSKKKPIFAFSFVPRDERIKDKFLYINLIIK